MAVYSDIRGERPRAELTECEQLDTGAVRTLRCHHGHFKKQIFRCGQCQGCRNTWIRKWRWRIASGAQLRRDVQGQFLTFTLREPTNRAEPRHILRAWRTLKRSTWWRNRYEPCDFVRVLELHRSGAVHLHILFFPRAGHRLPLVQRPRHMDSLRAYRRRQTDAGRAFILQATRAGFGPIMDIQDVRNPRAVGAYLSKYLAKSGRASITSMDGRRVRVIDVSKGWLPVATHSGHRWKEVRGHTDKTTTHCVAEEHTPAAETENRREIIATFTHEAEQSAEDLLADYYHLKRTRNQLYAQRARIAEGWLRANVSARVLPDRLALILAGFTHRLKKLRRRGDYLRSGLLGHATMSLLECYLKGGCWLWLSRGSFQAQPQ